jgi:hypothetical protein
MKSSWSSPNWPWPFGARTPSTRNGRFFTRTIWPTGSEPGKSVPATVAPSRQTLSAICTSRLERFAPDAIGQFG